MTEAYKDLRVVVAGVSEEVFIAKVAKNGIEMVGPRKNVTSDFIKAVIDKFHSGKGVGSGCETTLTVSDGKEYKIFVERLK